MSNSEFGGIFIPRELLADDDVPSSGKILYGFIQSLDGKKGCFARNAYLGGLIGSSEETVRALVYILEKKGYIARFRADDGSRIIRTSSTSVLRRSLDTPWVSCKEVEKETPENSGPPPEKSGVTPPEKSGVPIYSDIPNNTDSNDKHIGVVDYQKEKEFVVCWKEYRKYRKKMRRPMTEKAEELLLKKLANVPKETAIKAIELSIERSWIGIFPEALDYSLRKNNGNRQVDSREPLADGDHVTF